MDVSTEARRPTAAEFPLVITFLHAGLPGLVVLGEVSVVLLRTRPFYLTDLAAGLAALALAALAVASGVGLVRRRRWAWWGAVATNAASVASWIAIVVWSWIISTEIEGSDPGMIFASALFCGAPAVGVSVASVVVLVQPSVRRYYFTPG